MSGVYMYFEMCVNWFARVSNRQRYSCWVYSCSCRRYSLFCYWWYTIKRFVRHRDTRTTKEIDTMLWWFYSMPRVVSSCANHIQSLLVLHSAAVMSIIFSCRLALFRDHCIELLYATMPLQLTQQTNAGLGFLILIDRDHREMFCQVSMSRERPLGFVNAQLSAAILVPRVRKYDKLLCLRQLTV